jgi:hypothetical protein
MSKHSLFTGKALFMANISTMKHIKTAGGQTPVQLCGAEHRLYIPNRAFI